MECDKAVDPVWFLVVMREQRSREREEEYRRQRDEQFRFESLDTITELLVERGVMPSSSSAEQTPTKDSNYDATAEMELGPRKKRRLFEHSEEAENDPTPPGYRHIRSSERVVKERFYRTVANLSGHGLSIDEASKAICEVGNGMFDREWKECGSEEDQFGKDTLPTKRNIREALNLIEAQSISLTADKISDESDAGRMTTHAIDSTTKKRVGQFAVQGVHIG